MQILSELNSEKIMKIGPLSRSHRINKWPIFSEHSVLLYNFVLCIGPLLFLCLLHGFTYSLAWGSRLYSRSFWAHIFIH